MDEPQLETESVEFDVRPKMPLIRSKGIVRAAVGIGALVIVSLVAVALVRRTAAPRVDLTAQVMPSNVILYLSMTTRPDQQPNYNVVADAWKGSKEANMLQSTLQLGLASAGFNWEEDIQPWLGDRAALGLVDFGGPDTAGGTNSPRYREPFFVIAAQTRDRAKSDAFLAGYLKQQRDKLQGNGRYTEETYRGLPIVYKENLSQYAPYGEAYATVNDVVVLTNGPDNLKKVIDTALDGTNLAAGDNFKKTMAALPSPNVGAAYMDYIKYMESLSALMSSVGHIGGQDGEQQSQQMDQLRSMMQALGGVGAAMTYEPSGIRFDAAMQYDPNAIPEGMRALYNFNATPPANRIFDSIPASAILAMNASSPSAGWAALLDNRDWLNLTFGSFPGLQGDVADKIAVFEKLVGVDLKADLLDLFDGELAFVVLPKSDAGASAGARSVPFEIAVMLDSSDPGRAADSLSKLLEALLQKPESSYARVQPLSGLPYTALVDQNGGVILVYGVVDGRLVIGSSSSTLLAIDNADQSPLSADAAFKSAVAALPANRIQTGYGQLGPFWDWLGQLGIGETQGECGVCNYLKPVGQVSFADEAPDAASGMVRAVMHVLLKPVSQPSAR